MSISYVGGSTGTSSAVIPATQIGDLILVYSYSQNSTVPTKDPSFATVVAITPALSSEILGYKIATSTSETTGTWTNSEGMIVQVYRSSTGSLSIGSSPSTFGFGSGTTVRYDTITLDDSSGSSWVAGFAGHNSNNGALNTPPTGMTNREFFTSAALRAAGHDTNGGVTSWVQTDVSIGGSAGSYATVVAEIKETASSVTIDDVTDPLKTSSSLTINGSGFEALGANSKIEQIQGAITVELADGAWSDTQIVTTGADVESTTLKYGTHDIKVTAHSGATVTKSTSAIPATNNDYVNVVSLATSGDRITAIPDLAALDQLRYQSVLYQGGSPTAYTVTVNADATFSISGSAPDGSYTFEVRAWDNDDSTWGTAANQNVTIGAGGGGLVIPNSERDTYQDIAAYLRTQGYAGANNDVIVKWLISEGILGSQFNDLFSKYWGQLGYAGAYNDRWKKWKDG